MLGEFEHGRPFVFGMNGTFGGVFIPQMISLAPTLAEETFALPSSSIPEVSTPLALLHGTGGRAVDHFPGLFTAPGAPADPSFDLIEPDFFQWDAPALPAASLHEWDFPVGGGDWLGAQSSSGSMLDFSLWLL